MSLKKSCMLLYLKCQIAHTYTHTHTIAEKEENVKKENNATWQKHEWLYKYENTYEKIRLLKVKDCQIVLIS